MDRAADIELTNQLFSMALHDDPHRQLFLWPKILSETTLENIVRISSTLLALPAMHRGFRQAIELHDRLDETFEDEEFLQFLAEVAEQNKCRNRSIRDQMLVVKKTLEAAGIQPIWLKGAAHLLDGWELMGETRFLSDIDLLVSELELPQAIEALGNSSFHPQPDQFDNDHHHYPRLYHEHHSVGVEVHRRIVREADGLFNRWLAENNATEEVMWANHQWIVPSLKTRLFHLVHHTMMQNNRFEKHTISLRDQLDFSNLCKNGLIHQDVYEVGRIYSNSGLADHFAAFAEMACRLQCLDDVAQTGIGQYAGDGSWTQSALTQLEHPEKMRLQNIYWLFGEYYRLWRSGKRILSRNIGQYILNASLRFKYALGNIK